MGIYFNHNNSNSSGAAGGIGFCGLLTILFIALKLTNVINWSWLWVLCPLWLPAVLVTVIIVIAIMFIRK